MLNSKTIVGHTPEFNGSGLNDMTAAPGAGKALLCWEPGTTPGTAKLVAYAGTSATPTVIVDNVGAGF